LDGEDRRLLQAYLPNRHRLQQGEQLWLITDPRSTRAAAVDWFA
jgi:hypothetical protein